MYKFENEYILSELINNIHGDFSIINLNNFQNFNNVSSVVSANEKSIVFIANEAKDKYTLLKETKAIIIILGTLVGIEKELYANKIFIVTDSPRTIFSRIVKKILEIEHKSIQNIVQKSRVSPVAKIGKTSQISDGVIIGASIIGEGCKIMNNSIIEDGCVIGDNVFIGSNSIIGANSLSVILNENQSRGDGIPQLGQVVIESGVHIDSFSTIQRGTFGATYLRKGVKIDSYVQIAHNVDVGARTVIIGHSKISGSVTIGEEVFIGQSVSVANKCSIGKGAFICMGSVVIHDVLPGSKVFGNPAKLVISPKVNR